MVGEQQVLSQTIIADGADHQVNDGGCTGTQRARWSADGRRLFTRAQVTCDGQPARTVTGLALIAPDGEWVDVQAVTIGGTDSVRVRRYRGRRPSGGRRACPQRPCGCRSRTSRKPRKYVSPRAIEAALMETSSRFPLSSRVLRRPRQGRRGRPRDRPDGGAVVPALVRGPSVGPRRSADAAPAALPRRRRLHRRQLREPVLLRAVPTRTTTTRRTSSRPSATRTCATTRGSTRRWRSSFLATAAVAAGPAGNLPPENGRAVERLRLHAGRSPRRHRRERRRRGGGGGGSRAHERVARLGVAARLQRSDAGSSATSSSSGGGGGSSSSGGSQRAARRAGRQRRRRPGRTAVARSSMRPAAPRTYVRDERASARDILHAVRGQQVSGDDA